MKLVLLLQLVLCSELLRWDQYWQISNAQFCSMKEFICKNCTSDIASTRIVYTFENKETVTGGFIAVNDHYQLTIVTFKVTTSLTNWLQNFDLFQRGNVFGNRLKNGTKIHRGFYNAWISIQDELMMKIGTLQKEYPNNSLVFIGYSLGASLAVLASIGYSLSESYQNSREPITTVTFGQARLGNKEFAESLDALPISSRLYRIVAENDMITALPPRILNYYHSTGQVNLYPNGQVIDCIEDEIHHGPKTCSKSFWTTRLRAHYNYFGISSSCE